MGRRRVESVSAGDKRESMAVEGTGRVGEDERMIGQEEMQEVLT